MSIEADISPSEAGRVLSSAYAGQAIRILLCGWDGSLTRESPLHSWVALEVDPQTGFNTGYQRKSFSVGADLPGNVVGEQWVGAPLGCLWTASGSGFTYQAVVCILGGDSRSLIFFDPSTDVNVAGDYLQYTTTNPFANGTPVTVTCTGTMPGGLTQGGLYYAKTGSQSDRLELYTDAGLTSRVNLTSGGSGTLKVRWASGSLHSVAIAPSPITVETGQQHYFEYSFLGQAG